MFAGTFVLKTVTEPRRVVTDLDGALDVLSESDLDSSREMLSLLRDAPPLAANDDPDYDELPF
jgi:hypothetical protein